jgi:cobalt-zinc-cadmium efflux system membrane fusion protein
MPIRSLYAGFVAGLMLFIGLSGCTNTQRSKVITQNGDTLVLSLSEAEIKKGDLISAGFRLDTIERFVECHGYFVLPAHGLVQVTLPFGGVVKKILFPDGSYVKAGTVVALIENPGFITLQQEYLEAKNQYDYFRQDYQRQGELTVDNATSIKKMQQANREFSTFEIRVRALKAQLQLAGIDADSLRADNISPLAKIRAPISGILCEINAGQGRYLSQDKVFFEMIGNHQLQLVTYVPVGYFPYLKIGKGIKFKLPFDTVTFAGATTIHILKKMDQENQVIRVLAAISKQDPRFLPGMQVTVRIPTHSNSGLFLPSTAVVEQSGAKYIFIHKSEVFYRIRIETGMTRGDMVEIKSSSGLSADDSVVIHGAAYLSELCKLE